MSRAAIIFFISALLVSCKTTVVEEEYSDGSPRRVCVYSGKGASRELLQETTYYDNRQVMMKGTFRHQKRHGKWTSYYQDGTLWSESEYLNGKKEGRSVTYFENGKIRYEGHFRQDIRTGKWRFYDESGTLLKEVEY